MTDLSSRLASGDTLYGTFLGLGSALAAEACALAGFDWLLTDLEHGGGDESELLPQQLAADAHGVRCSSGSSPITVSAQDTPSTSAQPGSCSPGSNRWTRPRGPCGTSATPRTATAASPPTTAPTAPACTPNGSRRRTTACWESSRSRANRPWSGSRRSRRCPG